MPVVVLISPMLMSKMQWCNSSEVQWCIPHSRLYGVLTVVVIVGLLISHLSVYWCNIIVGSDRVILSSQDYNVYVLNYWLEERDICLKSSMSVIYPFQVSNCLNHNEKIPLDLEKRLEYQRKIRKQFIPCILYYTKPISRFKVKVLIQTKQKHSERLQNLSRTSSPMSNQQETTMNTITSGMQSACITRQARQPRRVIASPHVVEAAANLWANSLIGKNFTHEPTNFEDMKEEINMIWNRERRVTIKRVHHNLFIFKFQTEDAQEEVLQRAPWSVNGNLLGLQKYDTKKEPSQHLFVSQVWRVQIRGASQLFLSEELVDEICKDLGKRVIPQNRRRLPRGSLLSNPSIEINLSEPLRRGGWIESAAGAKVWVKYHFEKQLYNVCKKCYVVDHRESMCKAIEQELEVEKMTEVEFQFWKLHTEEGRKYMEAIVESEKRDGQQTEFCVGESSNNIAQEFVQEEEKLDRGSKRQRGEEKEGNGNEIGTTNHTVDKQKEVKAIQNTITQTEGDHTIGGHSESEADFEDTLEHQDLSANEEIVSEQKGSFMMEE